MMGTAIELPDQSALPARPDGLSAAHAEAVQEALDAARSPATRRAYAAAWRLWTAWADGLGYTVLPADPVHVAAYLADRAGSGSSAATLGRDVAAIKAYHLDAGADDPCSGPGVRRVLAGLRRTVGTAPETQAHPLSTAEIRRMVRGIDRSGLRGKRDTALIILGYAGALRRSELVGLNVRDLAVKSAGLVLTIRKSKADQEGAGVVVGVRRGEYRETDPVAAVLAWIEAAGLAPVDPLFQGIAWSDRRVNGRQLSGQSVNLLLVERAKAAGLGDLSISGHSLRAGHATTAAEAGVPAEQLARTTRHINLSTLAKYVRPAQVLSDSSSGSLGL